MNSLSFEFNSGTCPPYGNEAAAALHALGPPDHLGTHLLLEFRLTLLDAPIFSSLLAHLTRTETIQFRHLIAQHLEILLSPDLAPDTHHSAIQRLCNAPLLTGLDSQAILPTLQDFHALLLKHLASHPASIERFHDINSVLLGRFLNESRWMLEEIRCVEEKILDTLRGIERIELPGARPEFWVESVIAHLQHAMNGLTGISFSRARPEGGLVMEFASKGLPAVCALVLNNTEADAVEHATQFAHTSQADCIVNVAGLSGEVFSSSWRHLLARNHVRALASVPVISNDGTNRGVFTFWGKYPGLFQSCLMQLWLRSFQHVATLRFAHLARASASGSLLPMNERRRYRNLLAKGRLVMFYQPMRDLTSGRIFKFEALARLRADDGEILSPATFLPAFTIDDLILLFQLGLRQALEWIAQSDRTGQVFDLSFNLPPEVLALPDCTAIVREALSHAGVAPERLYLELLETESLPLSGSVADTLRKLSELGVALVMDDLGSGHSGINRLSEFPFQIAKLDRDLSRKIASMGKRGVDFLDSLVRMIHALGMSCTMEGLENEEMIEVARLIGVDHAQGYVIAHPMPPEVATNWVKGNLTTRPGQPHYPMGQYALRFARQMQGIDWDRAIDMHLSWQEEYLAAFDAGNAPHWRMVGRDDACMLGRWLKQARITHMGEQSYLDAIDQAHRAFHSVAGEHARTCQCEDASHVSGMCDRIKIASDALLREIERYRATARSAA
ncbi:MAG: hypothetical protein B7Y26_13205 [Hydrogenophilales bacterium 16-64-46]|nr:MAG: hypothetical protein B7Z32_12755 [Hydrogenophilales bacterium 12-64-13]OYZ04085.1 MAG: hypothetical protein B7Y26_13205 [Hydrogenophilales bacterium 16-64-46]OZA36834.1 MAG: hypothetical protein B7X87_12760 [Hydrogenophilales bacterium 17-64-34]HQT00054.1 EAL domain-containing protein [Thiobacillus sp.]